MWSDEFQTWAESNRLTTLPWWQKSYAERIFRLGMEREGSENYLDMDKIWMATILEWFVVQTINNWKHREILHKPSKWSEKERVFQVVY
mgnify:CR=1 FL=1